MPELTRQAIHLLEQYGKEGEFQLKYFTPEEASEMAKRLEGLGCAVRINEHGLRLFVKAPERGSSQQH